MCSLCLEHREDLLGVGLGGHDVVGDAPVGSSIDAMGDVIEQAGLTEAADVAAMSDVSGLIGIDPTQLDMSGLAGDTGGGGSAPASSTPEIAEGTPSLKGDESSPLDDFTIPGTEDTSAEQAAAERDAALLETMPGAGGVSADEAAAGAFADIDVALAGSSDSKVGSSALGGDLAGDPESIGVTQDDLVADWAHGKHDEHLAEVNKMYLTRDKDRTLSESAVEASSVTVAQESSIVDGTKRDDVTTNPWWDLNTEIASAQDVASAAIDSDSLAGIQDGSGTGSPEPSGPGVLGAVVEAEGLVGIQDGSGTGSPEPTGPGLPGALTDSIAAQSVPQTRSMRDHHRRHVPWRAFEDGLRYWRERLTDGSAAAIVEFMSTALFEHLRTVGGGP